MNIWIRRGFGAVFAAGAVVHTVLGQTHPEGYETFGHTAVAPLDDVWRLFVMPHIRQLTLVMAAIEAFIAIGLLAIKRWRRAAVISSLVFFAALLPLGYGWPSDSPVEDFLKNRLGSAIMIAAMLPQLSARGTSRASIS